MIARIRGRLLELSANRAVIAPDDHSGIGLEVLLPAYVGDQLQTADAHQPVELHTLTYLESLNQGASFVPRLIGFLAPAERAFFELLTTVKGLGNKRALRALAVPPGSVARAIADRDTAFLQRLPEIGPKLAELIVHELKSKVDAFALDSPLARPTTPKVPAPASLNAASARAAAPNVEPKPGAAKRGKSPAPSPDPPPPRPPIREAVAALIALGETPVDAERMVARALERSTSEGAAPPLTTPDLLSAAYAARA